MSTIWNESQAPPRVGKPTLLVGRASGTAADSGAAVRLVYGVLDLGGEKLVARFVGPIEQIALNESVLHDTLLSLEAERRHTGDVAPVGRQDWSIVATADGRARLPLPAGWIVEPGAPSTCSGLPPMNAATAVLPAHDLTVTLRVAVWYSSAISPDDAAAACSSGRAPLGRASYASMGSWLGVSYVVEGVFLARPPGQVVQLEVWAADHKRAVARAFLAEWAKRTAQP